VLDVGGVVLGGAWGIRLSGALACHVRYRFLLYSVCRMTTLSQQGVCCGARSKQRRSDGV